MCSTNSYNNSAYIKLTVFINSANLYHLIMQILNTQLNLCFYICKPNLVDTI